jgi:hypothetical protein
MTRMSHLQLSNTIHGLAPTFRAADKHYACVDISGSIAVDYDVGHFPRLLYSLRNY